MTNRFLETELMPILVGSTAVTNVYEPSNNQLNRSNKAEAGQAYRRYLALINDPNTKRIRFDSKQAALFGELNEPVPDMVQRGLKLPFDQFYLELTNPIDLPTAHEPGWTDTIRAFLVYPDFIDEVGPRIPSDFDDEGPYLTITVFTDSIPDDGEEAAALREQWGSAFDSASISPTSREGESVLDIKLGKGTNAPHRAIIMSGVGFHSHKALSDRTLRYSLKTGHAYVPVDLVESGGSTVPESLKGNIPHHRFREYEISRLFPAMHEFAEMPDREIGWWEPAIDTYATLLSWMLAYMMAKSIQLIAEPISRQQRRWLERRDLPIPEPFHLVKVDPKLLQRYAQLESGETSTTHGYRYDVIGHLRFGRHRRGDGTYSETIEWVPPHQRGLRHSTYIPKTSSFEGNRKIDSGAMRRYYKAEGE